MKLVILTPTRNRLDFLKQNVESVHFSSVAPIDLQIAQSIHDCGSDDGTAEWLREKISDRIHVTSSPDRVPPGAARNLAAAAVPGDYFMPLDDDDLLLQRTAHHFIHALENDKAAAWAVADFLKIDSEARYLPGQDYYSWHFSDADDMLRAIFSGRHFIQGNVCFSKELFEKVGGYSKEMKTAEDLELYVRFLLAAGLPVYVPTISHLHRMHDDNISNEIDKGRYNSDMEEIYRMHQEKLEQRQIPFVPIP